MIFSIFKKKNDNVPDIQINAEDAETLVAKTAEERLKEQREIAETEIVADAEIAEPAPSPEDEADSKMILRTDDLVKIYGKRTVVDHVSINVTQGEIVGLLGPNGAGKTTTFYMTTGLIKPNQGRIFLNDLDITGYPVYKRAQNGIGYLAQEASVFRKLSVEDNIRAVLQMTKKPEDYQKEKLESLISEFNLQKVRKNLGDQLSGGERRRTEIARCLAIDPKFIMLDEPFAGVDPIAVEDIQQVVYHLKEKNIGILITDHNAPETLSITDRAYLLFEGHILFQGTGEELADNPIVREKYLGRNFVYRRKNFD
jgi:lipopolysaccharide export system ATP-binding protein